jgi:hypothetical protein
MKCHYTLCNKAFDLIPSYVVHLNDHHKWTFSEIADFLEKEFPTYTGMDLSPSDFTLLKLQYNNQYKKSPPEGGDCVVLPFG